MATRGPTYVELLNDSTRLPFSSISPATTDGMNALVKFVSDGRVSKTGSDGQLGRSLFVKAEDEAFIRQLQVQILGLVRQDLSYINELLLPTQMTKDTKIRWNTIKFMPQSMVRNPALGVNYTHERIESQDEASAKRLGQHFEIEGDAWYTEKGQQDFSMNMAFWAVTIADTMAMTAWTELVKPRLESRRKYFDKVKNERTFIDAVIRQRDDTFAPYKNAKGIYRLVQDNCELMYTNTGKEANIMVMPRDKSSLITNGTAISTYQSGGERGLDLLMSKGSLGEIVPGLKVFPPPKFSINPAYDATTPLDADIRIGSFHVVKFATEDEKDNPQGMKKGECRDKLYDENEDRWKALPDLITCLKDCGRFDEFGVLDMNVPDTVKGDIRNNIKGDVNDPFYAFYVDLKNKAGAAVYTDGTARGPTPVGFDQWADWCLNPKHKCRFIVAAPFAGYRTQGALIASAGLDAGITTMSEPIVTKGEDPMTQVFKFNMTFWAGAYIFQPERFQLSRNVFYNGILGGGSVKLIDADEAERLKGNWENNSVARASLYFMVVGEGDIAADFIDLRGSSPFGGVKTYPSSAFYADHYGFDEIDDGRDEFVTQPIAPICFRREYNRWNGTKYCYEPGETHHGKIVGVGCREMRKYGKAIVEGIVTEASRD